jgi:ABC-type cobalamin/Fe3+-siderophores transport system ATPase subunit
LTQEIKPRLRGEKLTLGYSSNIVLEDIDIVIPDGRITALVGANGSGKSTLLRALGRVGSSYSGTALLDGKAIASLAGREVARTLALLPQSPVSPEGLTVRQLCRFGRHPHHGIFSRPDSRDEDIVANALDATGLTQLAERQLDQLSGGQRQRAWIAMALAQETPILLLDEPTTYLDIAHQFEVLELLKQVNRERGRTVVMVVHNLNHAAQYADNIIALAGGRILAQGKPSEVFTPPLIKAVFGIDAMVIAHPIDGTPLCLPFLA